MLEASAFLDLLWQGGTSFISGTPCSHLKPLIDAAAQDGRFMFRDAANEGDAVAMASGAVLAGKQAAVMFQNSGLGNAVNALTSLCHPFHVPLLMIISHRGAPGGPPDEPQHERMGAVTAPLLDVLGIPWAPFPRDRAEAEATLRRARSEDARPFALLIRAGDVPPHPSREAPVGEPIGDRSMSFEERLPRRYADRATRTEALQVIRAARRPDEVLIATTGYTARELFALGDDPWNFYLIGSMGSASAFGLGLALCRPGLPVTVVDGDGAILMRMGNLATVGAHAPPALAHVVLDNEAHDSTGAQPTGSRGVALGAVARACGYSRVVSTDDPEVLSRELSAQRQQGPLFVHFRTRAGAPKGLPRPTVAPAAVFRRLRRWLDTRR